MWSIWTSLLRFITELNVKSSVGARYNQLQVAEINPLESDEDSAFPSSSSRRFPQQSSASILIKSQLFPGMSLTQYLDQISPSSSTSKYHDTAAFNILRRGEHFTKLLFELVPRFIQVHLARNTKSHVSGRAARSSLLNIQKKI